MKLSICFPGVRPQNWLALYDSIPNITTLPKEEYELIIVSPYNLPPELEGIDNVRLIKDKGCPTRCYQLGLLHSQGEYVLIGLADDGVCPNNYAVDKAFALLPSEKGIVSFPYIEGVPTRKSERIQMAESWWHFAAHPPVCAKYIPNHYFLVMIGLMRRDYLLELGGFDCRIEHAGVSLVDLAVRLQKDGAKVVLGEKILDITFEAGTPLHKPIEESYPNDLELLLKIYSDITSSCRTKIDLDNWKQAEEVWGRRFVGGDK